MIKGTCRNLLKQVHLLYTCWDTCYYKRRKASTCRITNWSVEYSCSMVKSSRKFFYTKSFRFVFLKFKHDQLGQVQQVVEGVGLFFCSLAKSHSLPVTL